MNKSLLGSLDSPSGWDVLLFCQNQIGKCYNFPLVWFTWKISTYSSTGTCAHAPTDTHMRLLLIWTPDLFQPSDSHWHLPLELSLLTCWSWWEWMMFLLEEEKRGKEKRVGEWKTEGPGVDKLTVRPRESIWTPCAPERSQGDSALHPHYKRAITVTGDCELQYGFTAPPHNLSFTLTVHSHHRRRIQ